MRRLLVLTLLLPFFWQCSDSELSGDGGDTEYDESEFSNVTLKSGATVADLRRRTCAGTAQSIPLSRQIAEGLACSKPDQFGRIDNIPNLTFGSGTLPFLEASAAAALRQAAAASPEAIRLNSTWRSLAQQYLLDSWEGTSCVSLAATPGTSKHESGLAIDIANWSNRGVRNALRNAGFTWYCDSRNRGRSSGCRDRPHFTYSRGARISKEAIRAFQKLHNANSADKLTEDGQWGGNTRRALNKAPLAGYARSISCGGQPDAPAGDGWIGDTCADNAVCSYSGGTCGAGHCTKACAGGCPDRAGRAVTFCVDASELGGNNGGLCAVKSDARNQNCTSLGMVPKQLRRHIGSSGSRAATATVCVPPARPDPIDPPPPAGDGWVADACAGNNAVCSFSGGQCQSSETAQMCTLSCAGYCPDRNGESTTFCVAANLLGGGNGGLCTVKADNRNGDCASLNLRAIDAPRYIGSSSARRGNARVCVPKIAPPPDPDPVDPVVPGETVAVSHDREFRAVWIATVFNINFPSRRGLSVDNQKAELRRLLDTAKATHLNAVVFQVRGESDAFYRSELDPYSRYLTGTQGQDPGYDPLAYAIEQAHARGLELHAWLNPYRAAGNRRDTLAANHVARRYPQYAYRYGNFTWMDPGAEVVKQHTEAVVADIVTRYDVDGIHFDDYFYPYPDGTAFPDNETYRVYQAGGGRLGKADWRRQNVNDLVQQVSDTISSINPKVRFGISPFGIYRPGIPAGIAGLDQYAELYADPVHWLQEGWVDYLAPQLYWNASRRQQDYETLLTWWTSLTHGGHHIFAGNYLSKLGSARSWDVNEFKRQLRISRQLRAAGSMGNILFQIAPLVSNQAGIRDALVRDFYSQPALTPVMAGHAADRIATPTVAGGSGVVTIDHVDDVRSWVIYTPAGAGWRIARIVPADTNTIEMPAGDWAISAAGRQGAESLAVIVKVN